MRHDIVNLLIKRGFWSFGTSVRKTSIATPSQFVGIEGVELGTEDKVQYLLFTSSTKRRMIFN